MLNDSVLNRTEPNHAFRCESKKPIISQYAFNTRERTIFIYKIKHINFKTYFFNLLCHKLFIEYVTLSGIVFQFDFFNEILLNNQK